MAQPPRVMFKVMNLVHRSAFDLTKGRIGGKAMGMPVMQLTTIGRKSGEPRTTMLTSPATDGDALVIVASKAGADTDPAWFLNLKANPEVQVVMRGKRMKMRATIASAEDKERLWPQIVASYKGYASYQRKTDREIPVVLLHPVD